MRKYLAVLLAVLIIGVTPAVAAQYGEINQTVDPVAVKGKGTAESAVLSESVNVTLNETTEALNLETEPVTTGTENFTQSGDQAIEKVDTQIQDLNDTIENDTTENITIPQKDTRGVVMQSTNYTCGPAALATVLQNLGINSTEQELMVLAGTGESGTTLYGLVQAAQSKGLSATGMKLSVDELRKNHIVHIILDGEGHYSVIREITNESVYLADPSLGNIVMTREKFSEIYTGNALVVSDPQEVNQTNSTSTVQVENQTLASEEMLCIKGQQLSATANPSASQILTSEEMQTIRGKVIWKVIALRAGIGAAFATANYLRTTPMNRWTWQGVGEAVLWGAMSGIVGGKIAQKIIKWRKW